MAEIARLVAAGGSLVDALAGAPIALSGLSAAAGPGATPIGTFAEAVRFGPGARSQLANAQPLLPDRERFAFRVSFAARGALATRQNLVESTHVPAVLWIEPVAGDAASIRLGAGVQTPGGSWRTTVSEKIRPIGQWQSVALVLDDDVLAVIDEATEELLAAVAVPEAALHASTGTSLSVGTLPDGLGFAFSGDIAAVSWVDDVPARLGQLVDDWRVSATGLIDAKRWTLRFDPGAPLGPPAFNPGSESTLRVFANADIRFSAEAGHAFEMHGAIRDEYNRLTFAGLLGYPVSDEITGRAEGVRKNLFSLGAIYWSAANGALPVFEEIYLAYEAAGEAAVLGPPIEAEEEAQGGMRQRFAGGEIYLAGGSSTAFEVRGAILQQFLATGGVSRWGFPTTNTHSILRPDSGGELGVYSRFRGGTFYWSAATGAHVVHGAIADYYATVGGPQGRLGFPTSDEQDLPSADGARYNTFEHGAILWYPDTGAMEPSPLRVFIDTVDTQEDEGFGRGQNDLTVDVGLLRDGADVGGFQDVSDDHNIRDIKRELDTRIEPWPGRVYTLRVDVHERDPEDRPRLGLWEKRLDAGNGWGLRENKGILSSGSFSMINNITASVAPLPPAAGFTPSQRHWGTNNPKTATISRNTFATAFPDVDSEPEWWDVSDGIESVYYELVCKTLSANGNCFGFSAEGILAEKGSSLYQLPLDRFTMDDWARGLEKVVTVRHQSQMGADAIWTFVALFLSGNTHNPVDVFRITRSAFAAGADPVLCLAQNADFSGAAHAIRPIAWREAGTQWEIDVLDPNFAGGPRTLTIDPNENTFAYVGKSSYSGSRWSGGRLYYMPFHTFAGSATLPMWDAMGLVLAGTVAVFGDGDAATSITSSDGENLLLTGEPTRDAPGGGGLSGFVPAPTHAREVDPSRRFGDAVRVERPAERIGRLLGRVDEGVIDAEAHIGEIVGAVRAAQAVDSSVIARAWRPPTTQRRGPRGVHRGVRDMVHELEVADHVVVRERPHREDLHKKLDLQSLRVDENPLFLPRAAEQSVIAIGNTLRLRNDFAILATQLPEGEQRDAVIALVKDDSPLRLAIDDAFQKRVSARVNNDIGGIINRLISDDFVLDTVSLGGADGRIAISHALREYVVRHDGHPGSALRIAGQNLRTAANTLTVAPGTGRSVTLTVTNRVGLQGDIVRARFLNLPAEPSAPLTLNVRPGHAAWELTGASLQGAATAVVSGLVAGRRFGASYDLTLQSALRINFPLSTDAARLSVATTSGLFAEAIEVTKLTPR